MQENLTGIRVVKAFVRREHENNSFEKANDELYVASVKINRNLGMFMPFITLLMNLGTVAVTYFGGIQVFRGNSSVGEIIAFINYLSSAMFSVMILSSMAGQISAAEASAKRIFQAIDEEPKIKEKPEAIKLDNIKVFINDKVKYFEKPARDEDLKMNKHNPIINENYEIKK